MMKKGVLVLGAVVCLLTVAAVGMIYVGLSGDAVADGAEVESDNASSASDESTPTVTESSPDVSLTDSTNATSSEDTVVQSERVLNSSYDESDGSLKITFKATGGDWSANVYRSNISLTTLVPEEHTDSDGNAHPTTSYWNQNSSLPESKSYALIGSRIAAGGETETRSDDEYVVTVILPTVVSENIRFTLVADETAVTFYERDF